ncbi:peptidylprolyl isomerase [Pseudoalteromonas sp. SSDWG2]|uniref:peptidylprolyl isomerase n=1 Tax=Pseudoalteromonas sp. SSDWG2 TaxID=3139391 RepID=UPI003BAA5D5B
MKAVLSAGVLTIAGAMLATNAHATIVEFQTSQGSFQVNLFDQQTPKTVENFLGYVGRGDYRSTIVHRSVAKFVVQGGAFTFDESIDVIDIQNAVVNEPVYSNVTGTIAMAKQAGNVNSATSQWFFNTRDNSANLDLQNGGFTVFGQVIGDGMDVVNKINALATCSGLPALNYLDSVPTVNYSADECSQGSDITSANLVTINDVIIIDEDPNSAVTLSPVENTLIDDVNSSDSSSGSAWWLAPFALLVALRRKVALK